MAETKAKSVAKTNFGIMDTNNLVFSREEEDKTMDKNIFDIPLCEIDPFPDHPFKVKDDETMVKLVESIKQNGIITPAILRRKKDGRYEMISGHRRKRACELAGLDTLRSEIVDMTRDEAIILMVESNFQRVTVLPSEKAFAYKMRLEAMKRQGRRTDITSGPTGPKLRSNEQLAKEVHESVSQIKRYIRLTKLISELLEFVDDGQIALRPAVELSHLSEEEQNYLAESIDMEQCTPTHAQAIRMKKLSGEGKLTHEKIEAIMQEEKPNQKERIVLSGERIKKLFPDTLPASEWKAFTIAAIEHYCKYISSDERKNEK